MACPSEPKSKADYPRAVRVRARAEFDAVFANGRRAASPMLTVHFLADPQPARLGLAVSRKVDSRAVVRNRIKRALREAFRHHRMHLAGGAYVVVARAAAASAPTTALSAAFIQQLHRLGALPTTASNGTMPPASSSPTQAPTTVGASSPSAP